MEIKVTVVQDGRNNVTHDFESYEEMVAWATSRFDVVAKKVVKKKK